MQIVKIVQSTEAAKVIVTYQTTAIAAVRAENKIICIINNIFVLFYSSDGAPDCSDGYDENPALCTAGKCTK